MQDETSPIFILMEIFRLSGVLKCPKNSHFNTSDGNFWEFHQLFPKLLKAADSGWIPPSG